MLDTLYKEAIQAGAEARRTKENFEKGVDGYTQEMVDEAEQAYADAMGAFDNAYNDAYAIGEDFGGGIAVGITSKSPAIVQAAGSAIANAVAAARKEADSNSPSKKMIALGEDMGEGTEIGLDNKTPDVGKAAGRQVTAIMKAYDQHGKIQRTMTAVTERQATMQAKVFQSKVPDNTELLTKILTTLEKGQVLTLNGKAIVGGTVNEYDKELGYRRALVARGAL